MINQVVSRDAWIEARQRHLAREKEFTRLRDRLSAERRALPWVKVDKNYVFKTPDGDVTLAELFDGRSQLIVYHFMLGPDWDEGCRGCSFWTDNFQGVDVHLAARDVTLIAVSSAPPDRIEKFKSRMGWTHKWVSSAGGDFNRDYHVSFTPEDLQQEIYYNYRRAARDQRVLQRNGRHRVSHVFDVFPRPRHAQRRLPLPRPCTKRPR
jgi:predicted dithiol-disulfide oxidoreductase (DUF899 family)